MKKLNIWEKFDQLFHSIYQIGSFVLLLMLYLIGKAVRWVAGWRFFPKFISIKLSVPLANFYLRAIKSLDYRRKATISRINLIELAISNMKAKKTRTIVTVGGMMIGIGTIVFLVSIGYGLQQVVITRVARLEEMRQADITPQSGGKLKIDDKSLADFKDITAVEMSLPLIAVVGRVNYQNSVSDMAVYGVTSDYLRQSAIQPVQGKIFESNELTTEAAGISAATAKVAGVSTENVAAELGATIQAVDFSIEPAVWVRIRDSASTKGKVLGYTKRVEASSVGEEVWGGTYLSDNQAGQAGETAAGVKLGKWIKASVLLWKEQACDPATQGECEEGKYVVLRDEENQQVQKQGYFAEISVEVAQATNPQALVLGITTEGDENSSASAETADETVTATEAETADAVNNGSAIDWVEIASESSAAQMSDIKTVALASTAKKEAVVNRAMLKILGINENEAIGKKFTTSFVVVGELLADPKEKIESEPAEYTIVGVTPEEKTPVFFVPFIDLRTLGITNYSQVKVVVKNQNDLAKTRRQIEAMGYVTRSVADTVEQITALFSTVRAVLALLGMVALAVAALGMFNTLTVSLLERTREVGLMKAMGMKSSEVKELFLTESMIMGFFGGVLGIILGLVAGKLAGFVLSFVAIFKGVGFIDISYVPLPFVLVVVFLSLVVGILTGIYPARRATKISALNALRYE